MRSDAPAYSATAAITTSTAPSLLSEAVACICFCPLGTLPPKRSLTGDDETVLAVAAAARTAMYRTQTVALLWYATDMETWTASEAQLALLTA
jgi:hypothetical protein